MGWNPFKDSWSNVWDDFRSVGRALDDFVHGDWDSAAKEFSQSGFIGDEIFKPVFRVADDIVDSGLINVVNPVAGAALAYGRDGEQGLIKALTSTVAGNIVDPARGTFDFGAGGRFDSVKKVFKNLTTNPEKFVKENVLPNLGKDGNLDVSKVFQYAIANEKGGVKASNAEMAAIAEAVGSDNMSASLTSILSGMGLNNIEGIANLYEYYKEWDEDEAPTLPEITPMSDEVVNGWIDAFKDDLSEQKIEAVKRVQGIASRSGMDDGQYLSQLKDIDKNQAKALADFERQARQQQLEYNNQLAQQQYQNQMQLYTINQQRKKDVLNALANNIYTKQQNNPNMGTDQIVNTAVNGVNELFNLLGIDLNLGSDAVIIDESGGMQVNPSALDNIEIPNVSGQVYDPNMQYDGYDSGINLISDPRTQTGVRGGSSMDGNPNQQVVDLYNDRMRSIERDMIQMQVTIDDPETPDRTRAELQRDMKYLQEMYNEMAQYDPSQISVDLGAGDNFLQTLGYGTMDDFKNTRLSGDLSSVLTDEGIDFVINNKNNLPYMDIVKNLDKMGAFKTNAARQHLYALQNQPSVGDDFIINDVSGYKDTDMYKQLSDSGSRLITYMPDMALLSNFRQLSQENPDIGFTSLSKPLFTDYDPNEFNKFYDTLSSSYGGNLGGKAVYLPYYYAYKKHGLNQFQFGGKNITVPYSNVNSGTTSGGWLGAVGSIAGR